MRPSIEKSLKILKNSQLQFSFTLADWTRSKTKGTEKTETEQLDKVNEFYKESRQAILDEGSLGTKTYLISGMISNVRRRTRSMFGKK